MSEYTPTTDEVRGDYAHFQTPGGTDPVTGEFSEGLTEFDRWLAKHDAEVERAAAEKALTDAADECVAGYESTDNSAVASWLRRRAAAYRQKDS